MIEILTRKEKLDKYYEWLCHLINVNKEQDERNQPSYKTLMKKLFSTEFTWTVRNDANRAYEGRELRAIFCEKHDILYEFDEFNYDASMLETIIGLAFRCENIMTGHEDSRPMADWFWELMGNCGLTDFIDESFLDECVVNILYKIINRTFERDGKGGLFPIRFGNKDQRKVELWYQMNLYLVERYYTEDVKV